MALAPTIEYTIRDGDSDPATTSVHVPIGSTLANYGEFAVEHAQTIEAVILGVFDPLATLSIPVSVAALTNNTAEPASDVEQISQFSFLDANGEDFILNVPGRNELDVVIGTDTLDEADVEIAALITMMEDGIAVTGGTIVPSSIAESDLVSLNFARKSTRNSGKRR